MEEHEQTPDPMRGVVAIVQGQVAAEQKMRARHAALRRLSDIPMSAQQASKEKNRLLAAVAGLAERKPFKVGDVVCWKHDLKNCVAPQLGQPAVVVEVLDPPLRMTDPGMHGSPYYGECLDVRIALVHPEDEMITVYAAESWRLQHWAD